MLVRWSELASQFLKGKLQFGHMDRREHGNFLSKVSWPAILLAIFIFLAVALSWKFLPVAELQIEFWSIVIVGLLGDSVTTGLLGKYGLEEQQMGYTRWLCGGNPSMTCSFLTRLGVFLIFFFPYMAILNFELWNFHSYFATVILSPVALAAAGIGATFINGISILRRQFSGEYT